MAKADLKPLLLKLNQHTRELMEEAVALAAKHKHTEITPTHLIYCMLQDKEGDTYYILKHLQKEGMDIEKAWPAVTRKLTGLETGSRSKPAFSDDMTEWLKDAWVQASIKIGESTIRSGAFFFVASHRGHSGFGDFSGHFVKYAEAFAGSCENEKKKEDGKPAPPNPLDLYTTDFTALAKAGKLDLIFSREDEIGRIIDILGRYRKNNPILVGEAGVGKTAIVEGLALKVVANDVPPFLRNSQIRCLAMSALNAGTSLRGSTEERIQALLQAIKDSPTPILLFIDEAHTLLGGTSGASGVADMLKPALARGELRTIAATTWDEYKRYFEKDEALARRFQMVKIEEPTEEATLVMMRGLRRAYEKHHCVTILDEALTSAVKLSARYITERRLPDKAFDLVDTATAKVKIDSATRPRDMAKLEQALNAVDNELWSYSQDGKAGVKIEERHISKAHGKRNQRIDDLRKLEAEYAKRKQAPVYVTMEHIAKIVSEWTGIPTGRMATSNTEELLNFHAKLKEKIKGQDHAVESVAQAIKASRAGIQDPRKPLGVFFFVGASGIGKTETALALADLLFGGEKLMTTINMSEFQEKHMVARLIGSPAGYVGYGEGGLLTEAVRRHPYSVILLDEVEKAHPEIMNLFYQVFDKGVLTDGEGNVSSFKNTVIIMTSNIATDVMSQMVIQEPPPSAKEVVEAVRPALNKHFKPALVARMTVVPFFPLKLETMREIVHLKLRDVAKRMFDNHEIEVTYTELVVETITGKCQETELGARLIDNIIKTGLLPKVSEEVIKRSGNGGLPPKLEIDAPKGEFVLNFNGKREYEW